MAVYSIVVPIFNEENRIEGFFSALKAKLTLSGEYEVVFVDDGSYDFSSEILKRLANENSFVKLVVLDKNYGKEAAIAAGIKQAKGDAVIVMTLNSGNPFDAVKLLSNKWLTGSLVVYGYRKNDEPKWWTMFKFRFMKWLVGAFGVKGKLMPKAQLELYDRRVVEVLNKHKNQQTLLRNCNQWDKDVKLTSFEFEARRPSERGIEAYKKSVVEHKERRARGEKNKRTQKTRLYAKSFITSSILFIVGMTLLTTTLILNAGGWLELGLWWIIFFGYFLSIATLIMSALFWFRGLIIRRLGIVKANEEGKLPYEIKEIFS